MTGPGNEWFDEDAGPLVRSYALTRGRARPVTREAFDMMAVIEARGRPSFSQAGIGPEHLAILELCRRPLPVAEISGQLHLPLVVVRVLLGDLLDQRLIGVMRPRREEAPGADGVVTEQLLREVLHGLEAL
ncbi:DUF742 domain-containing protein [Spirillospora sp. NPDC047279]|uniref:DUF742 domain-containing protein n=1 Tax=Spirillospora sp. NPDC047279 TaxID=3155478 RepID=UPI0033C62857